MGHISDAAMSVSETRIAFEKILTRKLFPEKYEAIRIGSIHEFLNFLENGKADDSISDYDVSIGVYSEKEMEYFLSLPTRSKLEIELLNNVIWNSISYLSKAHSNWREKDPDVWRMICLMAHWKRLSDIDSSKKYIAGELWMHL